MTTKIKDFRKDKRFWDAHLRPGDVLAILPDGYWVRIHAQPWTKTPEEAEQYSMLSTNSSSEIAREVIGNGTSTRFGTRAELGEILKNCNLPGVEIFEIVG